MKTLILIGGSINKIFLLQYSYLLSQKIKYI